MTLNVRRIVTGHDEVGKAIVQSDETISAVSRGLGVGIEGVEIWSTDRTPVPLSDAEAARQRAGIVTRHNYVGTGAGSTIRITEWAPGHSLFPHRTHTLDYAILLTGQLDLELDDGVTVTLLPGDVVVQRGTIHSWVNRSDAPATIAFILLDAEPPEAAGCMIPESFERPRDRP